MIFMEEIQRKPILVAEVIRGVLENFEKSDLKQCGKIFLHWDEIIGEKLALHTRPESVRAKKLKVIVDSSEWLYEIHQNHEKQILENVQSWVGEETVKEIRYSVGETTREE